MEEAADGFDDFPAGFASVSWVQSVAGEGDGQMVVGIGKAEGAAVSAVAETGGVGRAHRRVGVTAGVTEAASIGSRF